MKIYIASDRLIGNACREWAEKNMPEGCSMAENDVEVDIYISVLSELLLNKEQLERYKVAYNFHPGVLPEYRGSGACSWVIINKEEYAGVTLHVIDEGIDTGPIIDIQKFALFKEDTAAIVFVQTERLIFKMFKEWFKTLATVKQGLSGIEQSVNRPSRLYKRKDLEDAKDLTRFVRAFTFEGKERAYYWKDGVKIYL